MNNTLKKRNENVKRLSFLSLSSLKCTRHTHTRRRNNEDGKELLKNTKINYTKSFSDRCSLIFCAFFSFLVLRAPPSCRRCRSRPACCKFLSKKSPLSIILYKSLSVVDVWSHLAASLHLGGVLEKEKKKEKKKGGKPTKGEHSDDVSGTLESRTTPMDLVLKEKKMFEAPSLSSPLPAPPPPTKK